MNIVIITPETLVEHELEICNRILEFPIRLHIRKPHFTQDDQKKYLDQLNPGYFNKLSLHQFHELASVYSLGGLHWKSNATVNQSFTIRSKSFHSIEEIEYETEALTYGFLSPIFDSISKEGYQSAFDHTILADQITKGLPFPVYALGGVTWEFLENLENMGFDGAALLGSFWLMKDDKKRFELLKQITNGNC